MRGCVKYFVVACLLVASTLVASEHRGKVQFGQVPIPGAVVQAKQGEKTLNALTGLDGTYEFPDLADGTWTIQVAMSGFEPVQKEVVTSKDAAPAQWDLKMVPIGGMQTKPVTGFAATAVGAPVLQTSAPTAETQDRILINGSVSNGASTPFALAAGFGNNRRPGRSLYTGNLSVSGNNAIFDARSFSLSGQDTAKPAYNRLQSTISYGGPFQIPHLFRNGNFTVTYSRTQNRNANLQTVQMPTAAQRAGDFSASTTPVIDPTTGNPFAGNIIPQNRISPQAKVLAGLFPLPNFNGSTRFNYQIPNIGTNHGDNINGTLNNITINNANRLSFTGGYSTSRSDSPDVFGFTDAGRTKSVNGSATWTHRFTQRQTGTIRYQFSRSVNESLPYFGRQIDVSGIAGVTGADRDPRNWGPPALSFSSGIAGLSTGSYANDRNQSHTVSYSSSYIKGRHAFSYSFDMRRQQFNLLSQREARGRFTFTGELTQNDFADFLLGVPTTSSLAFGNADKYFRQSFYNGSFRDDYKIRANITADLGFRWEYETPITEKQGRLVNLDITPGFASATPKIAGSSSEALIRPDKLRAFIPRIGIAWRPRAASSMIVRFGYGISRDTTVYRALADQMAQQSPLSKSLNVRNTPSQPLTLADGFKGSPSVSATTFAIDPRFKVGTAQAWNLVIQQDLPQAMQMVITYLGIKGTHIPQRLLPNTYASGGANPCAACTVGYTYLTSGGNSSRQGGTIEVRRRQRNGFQASVNYTYAKAIDNAGLGGSLIAQNWLDLKGERALSNFDQRHAAQVQVQYTSGMLTSLGGFWDGWRGSLFKQWSITANMNVGSGRPLTPMMIVPAAGTGITGSQRPNFTGAPVYLKSNGGYLNPDAFTQPAAGQWGNAGRNTITGPGTFSLNASISRSFRLTERIGMDLTVNATNILNHVTFPSWNTVWNPTANNSLFGVPQSANQMRSIQPQLRVRF
jgi:hypothetical protein